MSVVISSNIENDTLRFAETELRRCMAQLVDYDGHILLQLKPESGRHPFDDRIEIEISNGTGTISGPTPRSILLGVYRYLYCIGCRFLFPGKEGELLPASVNPAQKTVKCIEEPNHRYRGICIEGADRLENIIDIIDFLPKVGMNSYFIQFRQGYVFFRRWEHHTGHPVMECKDRYSVAEAEAKVNSAVQEIKRRGLIYHAVGHGWTCDPFGVPGLEWDPWPEAVPQETAQYFALLNGKRELFHGVPLNTSLCWSNQTGRAKVVSAVLDYARTHSETDIIHVWLSDGMNNQCECESCRKMHPADWYVTLLNEIDEALIIVNSSARVCFIIYSDLLWPPTVKRLHHPERFIIMFAPISRTYRVAFSADTIGHMQPYVYNNITLPESVGDNLAYLKAWHDLFRTDGLIFDYHYMWAHHKDAGGMDIAHVLYEDIKNLHSLGLNGYMSCQVQRAFFPHALGLTVMGQALWGDSDYESIVTDYFSNLYAENAAQVRKYFDTLSECCIVLDLEHPEVRSMEKAEACKLIYKETEKLLSTCSFCDVSALPIAGRYLHLHALLWKRLSTALLLLQEGNIKEAASAWNVARTFMWEMEPHLQNGLDCFNFDRTYKVYFDNAETWNFA